MKSKLIILSLLLTVTFLVTIFNISIEKQALQGFNKIEWIAPTPEIALAKNVEPTSCTPGTGGWCAPGPDGQICQSMAGTCNCTCGS